MGKSRADPPIVSTIPELDKGPLKRVLGVSDLFAIGYGDLGSSIFYALGVTAAFALGATPLALALAGFVFICTALSYAEMTSIYHDVGGSASFCRHAFNDLISFIAGWGLLLDYIVTIAISAFTVGPYLSSFFPVLTQASGQVIFAILLIVVLFWINFFGVKQSAKMSFVLMAATIAVQAGIIVVGLVYAKDIWRVFSQLAIGVKGAMWSPSWDEFIKGTAMAMVAYTGIESIAQLGAETKRPARTVPRSIVLTMFVLLVIYLGLSWVSLSLLSPEELGKEYTAHPLEGMALRLPFGKEFFVPCVSVLAAVVLFVASNAGLIGASRLSFNMGQYYQLPRFFYKIHPRFRTPYVSLAFYAIAAAVIVALSQAELSFLADLYNFGAQLAFFSTHMSLIMLRIQKPHQRRPFKVPFNIRIRGREIPVTALLGSVATLCVWLLVVIEKPGGRYLGMTWIAFGLAMYFTYRKTKKIPAMGQVKIEKIKIPVFKPLSIKHILVPLQSGTEVSAIQMACELAKLHGSFLTAISVIEIPFSLPLDTPLPHRVHKAGAILKAAEAIAIDQNLKKVDLQILRARSRKEAILEFLKRGTYDLIVMGGEPPAGKGGQKGIGMLAEEIVRDAPCRVWVCGSDLAHSETLKQSISY